MSWARRLSRHGYVLAVLAVVVIDKDPTAFRLLPPGFRGRTIEGYGLDRQVLEEAGIGEADLVASLLAKNEYKVKKAITAVRNPRNRRLYNRSWGVDVAIDSAQIVAHLIEEEATLTDLVKLLDLHEGEVTITSITATADGVLAGKTFEELHVPPSCYPAALIRGHDVVMPGPGVRIAAGDQLLVIAGPGGECHLTELA